MRNMMSVAMATSLFFVAPAQSAHDGLFGNYILVGGEAISDAQCAKLVPLATANDGERITVSVNQIQSAAEGYGPVKFGATTKGKTPFVMQANGPDGSSSEKGTAIHTARTLILKFDGGWMNVYCRL